MKRFTCSKWILLALCWIGCGVIMAAEDWMENDDIVIVHYPSRCKTVESIASTISSNEWVEFIRSRNDDFKKAYHNAVKKNTMTEKMDKWVRAQLPDLCPGDDFDLRRAMKAYYDHVEMVVATLDVNFKAKAATEKVSGTLLFIVDRNLYKDQKAEALFIKELEGKKIQEGKDFYLVRYDSGSRKVYLGIGEISEKRGIAVIGYDRDIVEAKLQKDPVESVVSKLIDPKEKTLNSIYLNLSFFKKMASDFGALLPEMTGLDMCRTICGKMNTVVYSVEKGESSGLTFSLKADTESKESAEEIRDLLQGVFALVKLKGRQKEESMTGKEKLAYQSLKFLETESNGSMVSLNMNLSRELVESSLKDCLKLMKDKVQRTIGQ